MQNPRVKVLHELICLPQYETMNSLSDTISLTFTVTAAAITTPITITIIIKTTITKTATKHVRFQQILTENV